jgi:hypothetical protein
MKGANLTSHQSRVAVTGPQKPWGVYRCTKVALCVAMADFQGVERLGGRARKSGNVPQDTEDEQARC